MRVTGAADYTKNTADNTADMLKIMKETKEPIKNNEKHSQIIRVESEKTAENTKGQLA